MISLIGKEITAEYAGCFFSGKVVFETKNTIVLESGKTLLKKSTVMIINGKKIVGAKIARRPEDRIKV